MSTFTQLLVQFLEAFGKAIMEADNPMSRKLKSHNRQLRRTMAQTIHKADQDVAAANERTARKQRQIDRLRKARGGFLRRLWRAVCR